MDSIWMIKRYSKSDDGLGDYELMEGWGYFATSDDALSLCVDLNIDLAYFYNDYLDTWTANNARIQAWIDAYPIELAKHELLVAHGFDSTEPERPVPPKVQPVLSFDAWLSETFYVHFIPAEIEPGY